MPNYFNPGVLQSPAASVGQINNNVGNAGGFGSGFLGGMNQDYANQFNNQSLSDEQLQHAIQQVLLQKNQSDLGVTQATNANVIAGQGVVAGQYADGSRPAAMNQDLATQTAESQGKEISAKDQVKQSVAPYIVQMDQYIKARGDQFSPTNQQDLNQVQQYNANLKAHGVSSGFEGFPDSGNISDLDSQAKNAAKIVSAQAQAAVNTPGYQQELGKVQAQATGNLAVESGRAASAQAVATTTQAGNLATEKARAASNETINANTVAGRLQVAQVMAETTKSLGSQLDSEVKRVSKSGYTMTPADVGNLTFLAKQYEWSQAQYELQKTVNYNKPDALAAARAGADAQAQKDLMAIPGYAKAVSQQGGAGAVVANTPAPPNAAAASQPSATPTSIKTPDGTTLNIGDTYKGKKWNGGDPSNPKSWT